MQVHTQPGACCAHLRQQAMQSLSTCPCQIRASRPHLRRFCSQQTVISTARHNYPENKRLWGAIAEEAAGRMAAKCLSGQSRQMCTQAHSSCNSMQEPDASPGQTTSRHGGRRWAHSPTPSPGAAGRVFSLTGSPCLAALSSGRPRSWASTE